MVQLGCRQGAFSGCSSLTRVTIPNSVTSIDSSAFDNCGNLSVIIISKNLTHLDYAFWNTAYYKNESNWEGGVLYLGEYLIATKDRISEKNYVVKDGTKLIADGAFTNTNIQSLTVPDSVKIIGEGAFRWSESLVSVYLGDGVTHIGKDAFEGCRQLEAIQIGNNVEEISERAFYNCESITSIKIPNSVTLIGVGAFGGCANLISVNFDGTIEQWNSIIKEYWNYAVPATEVHCIDGDISIPTER